jgi:hypothetical protein
MIEQINSIASLIVVICSALMSILAIIEKSNKIKLKPLSKLFGRKELFDKIDLIGTKIDNHIAETRIDEKDRLGQEIMSFASLLRNGYIPDTEEFKNIHKVYDKYRSLDGNGFAKIKMEYIEQKERDIING